MKIDNVNPFAGEQITINDPMPDSTDSDEFFVCVCKMKINFGFLTIIKSYQ